MKLKGGGRNIREFYESEEDFSSIRANLKIISCPHCHRRGCFILHGYLYGYGEKDPVQRGRRIFCSNRGNRDGCGRTWSFLLAGSIRNFMIFAGFLSLFLEKLHQGFCPAEAAREAGIRMSDTTIYRLYHRFARNQSRIRTYLSRVKDPPPLVDVADPLLQTIVHLKDVFTGCIVSRFQLYFQAPFFR